METTVEQVEQTEIVGEMPQPKVKRASKAKRAPKARRASTTKRARTTKRAQVTKAKSRARRPTMGTSKPRVAKLRRPPHLKRRRR
jgi:hypothetical protein